MKSFKNITGIREYCKDNSITFTYKEGREILLARIKEFLEKKTEEEEFSKLKTSPATSEKRVPIEAKADGTIYTLKQKEVELKCFNAYEFGQLYKLGKTDILYLNKKYGRDHKETYDEWINICKVNKVVD